MKCDKCGKDIPEILNCCPTCKVIENRNQINYEKITIENKDEQEKQVQAEENNRNTKKEERIQREEKLRQILNPLLRSHEKRAFKSLITSFIIFLLALFIVNNSTEFTNLNEIYRRLIFVLPLIANLIAIIAEITRLHMRRLIALVSLSFSVIVLLFVLLFLI